jgi:hypothetical protein
MTDGARASLGQRVPPSRMHEATMLPSRTPPTWTCTTCSLEIRHHPTFHVGLAFCCAGCVAGGPCTCSYDEDPAETYAVVLPEVGDPTQGQVSADAPVGLAVLGRRAGDRVVVAAPAGVRSVEALVVE